MSISIEIAGNREYCKACGLIGETRYDCQTCDFDGKRSDCRECQGKGYVAFEVLPFEMNVCNGNFRTLWNALALPYDHCGEVSADAVLDALRGWDADLCVRAEDRIDNPHGASLISFGVSQEQAQSYEYRLLEIAKEAKRRGESIGWC